MLDLAAFLQRGRELVAGMKANSVRKLEQMLYDVQLKKDAEDRARHKETEEREGRLDAVRAVFAEKIVPEVGEAGRQLVDLGWSVSVRKDVLPLDPGEASVDPGTTLTIQLHPSPSPHSLFFRYLDDRRVIARENVHGDEETVGHKDLGDVDRDWVEGLIVQFVEHAMMVSGDVRS